MSTVFALYVVGVGGISLKQMISNTCASQIVQQLATVAGKSGCMVEIPAGITENYFFSFFVFEGSSASSGGEASADSKAATIVSTACAPSDPCEFRFALMKACKDSARIRGSITWTSSMFRPRAWPF